MTIASTQLAMAYVGFTASQDTCAGCFHSHQVDTATASEHSYAAGLRCVKGAFFVAPRGTCKHFQRHTVAPAAPAPMQVGPTDI